MTTSSVDSVSDFLAYGLWTIKNELLTTDY